MTRKTASYISIQAIPDASLIRTQQFNGDPHLIIPMVILVEGVLHPSNSATPDLALASEFGRYPDGWNGRPVLLNHPTDAAGSPTSANSTTIVENQQFGQLFNTVLDGKKLKTEAWVNMTRVNSFGGETQELIENIRDGKVVAEVSTGLFTTPESVEGIYGQEKFNSIWREVVPDHLAILSIGTTGACSVEDGCGTPKISMRYLSTGEETDMTVKQACTCQNTSGIDTSSITQEEIEKSLFGVLLQKFKSLMDFKGNREMNHPDISTALLAALSMEDPNSYYYIIATYNDRFIYVKGWNDLMLQRAFVIDESDLVSLGADSVQVRPVTDFVPVSVKAEEPKANSSTGGLETPILEDTKMKTREQRVQALIDNKATKFEESDKVWLLKLEDTQIDKLEVVGEVKAAPEEETPAAGPTAETPEKPLSLNEYIAQAPREIRDYLSEGIRMQSAHRTKLSEGIVASSDFKAAELAPYDTATLERMYKGFTKQSFAGMGAGVLEGVTESSFTANSGYADDPEPLVLTKAVA